MNGSSRERRGEMRHRRRAPTGLFAHETEEVLSRGAVGHVADGVAGFGSRGEGF